MSAGLTIEMLYPEIGNLHGDNANIEYLAQCRPGSQIIRTGLTDVPAFTSRQVDLLYLGPMTEEGQLKVIDRLRPHSSALRTRIESGAVTLFTHNALEVLGSRILNDAMAYDVSALGIFDFVTHVNMTDRYNGKVMGSVSEVGAVDPILGYKSQFSMIEGGDDLPGFLTAERGIGRNRSTSVEGVRVANFFGTSLIGPLLTTNPYFTKALLRLVDPHTEAVLAHEEFAIQAYNLRLEQFRRPSSWFPEERVQPNPERNGAVR